MSHGAGFIRGVVVAAAAWAWAAGAGAAPVVSAADAAGAPGAVALPALSFSFDAPYAVLSFGLQFTYDGSLLSFDASASRVVVDGVTLAFDDAVASLSPLEFSATYGTDAVTGLAFADYSYIPMTSLALEQSIVFMPAFRIATSALPGQQALVEFSGDIADDATGTETVFATSALVSAVPEPATWLSLCAGLAVLGGLARRRHAAG